MQPRIQETLASTDAGARRSRLAAYWDLLLVSAFAVLAALVIASGVAPLALQAPLGLLLALGAPGYAVVAALFPRRREITDAVRLALSIGLSVTVIPPVAFVLSYTPLLIKPASVAGALALTVCACCAVAAYQRSRLGADEPFVRPFEGASLPGRPSSAHLMVPIAALLVLVALLYAIAFSGEPARYAAFSVTGVSGRVQDLPATAVAGDEAVVRVGVTNREGIDRRYLVRAMVAGRPVKELHVAVKDGELADVEMAIPVSEPGANQKVELLLFADDSPQPSRTLHFFINVTAP